MNVRSLFEQRVEPGQQTLIEYLPDGEAVLLNTRTERYFGLDSMGVQIWSTLVSSPTIGEAYESLLDEYDVEAVRLRADLENFVEDLVSNGLLEVTAG